MPKFQEPVSREGWKPSAKDAHDLTERLKAFPAKDGHYPFELFLADQHIISFDKFNRWQVVNPLQFHRYNEINSLRGWMLDKDLERILDEFPEEKAAYAKKIHAMFESLKNVIHLKTT